MKQCDGKPGCGPGFLDDDTHDLIHELHRLDYLMCNCYKQMRKVLKMVDKKVKEPYRFEHGREYHN